MTCIAILGTSSNCGKSTIVTLLCRYLRNIGLNVTPFKPQNMSLNSTSTWYGEEIAYIQYIQSKVCNIKATSYINPILIKPYEYNRSEVIVLGEAKYFTKPEKYYQTIIEKLRDVVTLSYKILNRKFDIVVMEGAGCVYEPNLEDVDIANLEIIKKFEDVKIILVSDIYYGGSFTSLYGTYICLPEYVRRKVVGFIINKFCGDSKILEPALEWLKRKTGREVLSILPLSEDLNIFPEDSVSLSKIYNPNAKIDIAIIYYPYISNFGEFSLLAHHPEISIRFVYKPSEIGEPDLLVLPGCRNTFKALEYLKKLEFDKKIKKIVGSIPIIGICAGYQILSKKISDPTGLETGTPTHAKGLSLLNLEFRYSSRKVVARVKAISSINNIEIEGFKIHRGMPIKNNEESLYMVVRENTEDVSYLEGSLNEKYKIYGTTIHETLLNLKLLSKIIDRNLMYSNNGVEYIYRILIEKLDRYVKYVNFVKDLI